MMKNFWRQLEVWAIRLKNDPFIVSRLNITAVVFTTSVITQLLRHFVFSVNIPFWNSVFLTLFPTLCGFFLSGLALGPLRRIVRSQKRLIADVSHELRTPLSIIKADSEIALLDGFNIKPQVAMDTFTSTLEEVDRMSKVIVNLLNLSLYENRNIKIQFQKVNLAEIVYNIAQKTHGVAIKKGLELIITNQDAEAMVMGNVAALEQMTMNLIRNALHYTPAGGSVKVEVQTVKKHNGDFVELIITDTGIGIASEVLPHVFSPFYRVSQHSSTGSSGLGLTIVKNIVDRHKGFIDLKSELNKGTTVIVTLPQAEAE